MTTNNHYTGLNSEQVLNSRRQFGDNLLTQAKKESVWAMFFEKFKDPIIIILLVALSASFLISFYEYAVEQKNDYSNFMEPFGIFLAIMLSTGVAFYFERNANKQFEILNKVNDDILYKVIRDGKISQVLKKDIVVGDVIVLETGEEIPADGEILESVSLQVNESSLTGEPFVNKGLDMEKNEDTYPSSYLCRGSSIIEGHCIYKVTKVGDDTEYGKVFKGVQIESNVQTPLTKELSSLADIITKVSYSIAALVFVGRAIVYFSQLGVGENIDWMHFWGYMLNTLMLAVMIIVVAVPEGLPMSVTLSLAYSMRSMMKTNNLVRKMHACETMGATTVICTDKTGTLTQNQMRVSDVFFVEKTKDFTLEQLHDLEMELVAVNSTAHLERKKDEVSVLGNPTEGALLLWLNDKKVDYLHLREQATIVSQLTFSTERKFMATLAKSHIFKKTILMLKGAPEIVMNYCKGGFENGIGKKEFEQKLHTYQSKAMRTIGFAYKVIENESQDVFENGKLRIDDLIFVGVAAISDPVREEVPLAIGQCMDASISVKIVTGDTSITAKEIARQIGLWDDSCTDRNHITGEEFAKLSDRELLDVVRDLKVISRARPMDKARLVNALQELGEVVAVTGDGTNDAPALKAAQVGLSMGDGTSVAKEASDITILDNSFASIGKAVMWGRSLYLNIQRFIIFQMTINVVACLIVLLGSFLGVESPLTVTQMLWVNLIMDTFAALALASLPPRQEVMKDKPRESNAKIITKKMATTILGVGMFFLFVLFGFIQYFKHTNNGSLKNFNLHDYFVNYFNFDRANTALSSYELSMFFSIFVFLQFWNMFNAKAFKTGKSSFENMGKSIGFLSIAFVIAIGQIAITTFGGKMFGVTPLLMDDWIAIIAGTSLVLVFGELSRLLSLSRR